MYKLKNIRKRLLHTMYFLLPLTGGGWVGFSSCSDFLEVDVKGSATIPNFLSDPEGLRAGLVGAYHAVYNYYDGEFMKYPDVAGNMLTMRATNGAMSNQYNYSSNQTQETEAVGHIWAHIYDAQCNVNNIIQYAPDVISANPAKADQCRQYLGQAYLLRAMCHFDQCRTYAQSYNYAADASHLGVPVLWKTPGADQNVSRSTVKQVYDAVLKDLASAAEILTDDVAKDYRYASLQAVRCMYSRVYLYMEDWEHALEYARLAIGRQLLAQGTDYLDMYRNLTKQGEAVFRLSGYDMNGSLKSFYDQGTSVSPADTLLSLFDADDLRLQLMGITDGGVRYTQKYSPVVVPENDAKRDDPFVFRLSEEFLNAAEAAWHLGQYGVARQYIGAIVERAVGTVKSAAVLAAYDDASLIDLIRRERVKELCFEGHNLWDITRWKQDLVREAKTTSTVRRISYPSDLFVLPIPQTELFANENMQPNPTVNN